MTDDLLTRRENNVGFLTLNRPKAIHALTLDMCRAMTEALLQWRDDADVHAVILEHGEGRGFCSGGDINLLRHSSLSDHGVSGRAFFWDEYRLNHLLFTYPKPIVAFMDGITMGGGVGISQPARYRIATENTRFAMPETGIGLFPDVGGGWYLSRLEGRLGQFMALTGARLDGAEALWAGLATHYLKAASIAEAKQRIVAGEEIDHVLSALSVSAPQPRLKEHAAQISEHFAFDRLEDVLASLAADEREWAVRELTTLRTKSPLSCKVSLRQLATSAGLGDFADIMAMEYRLGSRMLLQPDFAEGVRAVIVDKDNTPHWTPPTPEEVDEAQVDAIFAPLPADEEWSPLPA